MFSSSRGQSILEYLLLTTIVAVIVIFAIARPDRPGMLSQTQIAANSLYTQGAKAIVGGYFDPDTNTIVSKDPEPVDGAWCAWGSCINGYQERECACPRPRFGGKYCANDKTGGAVKSCGDGTEPNQCQPDPGVCIVGAEPGCEEMVTGVDNCGFPCVKQGKSCCTKDPSICSAPEPECGKTTVGVDNCGDVCSKTGSACCIKDCSGRECGPDKNNCGQGDCGTCASNEMCSAEYKCVCMPQCGGKECGSSGCPGQDCEDKCPAKGPQWSCDYPTGTCKCTPQCAGVKQCGIPDSCGGVCGAGDGAQHFPDDPLAAQDCVHELIETGYAKFSITVKSEDLGYRIRLYDSAGNLIEHSNLNNVTYKRYNKAGTTLVAESVIDNVSLENNCCSGDYGSTVVAKDGDDRIEALTFDNLYADKIDVVVCEGGGNPSNVGGFEYNFACQPPCEVTGSAKGNCAPPSTGWGMGQVKCLAEDSTSVGGTLGKILTPVSFRDDVKAYCSSMGYYSTSFGSATGSTTSFECSCSATGEPECPPVCPIPGSICYEGECCVPDNNQCDAPEPECGETTSGKNNCGQECTKTKTDCCPAELPSTFGAECDDKCGCGGGLLCSGGSCVWGCPAQNVYTDNTPCGLAMFIGPVPEGDVSTFSCPATCSGTGVKVVCSGGSYNVTMDCKQKCPASSGSKGGITCPVSYNLPQSAHGATVNIGCGTCPGTQEAVCNDGTWEFSGMCGPTCEAQTVSYGGSCPGTYSLGKVVEGSTFSGSCGFGCSGSRGFECKAAGWQLVTDTCSGSACDNDSICELANGEGAGCADCVCGSVTMNGDWGSTVLPATPLGSSVTMDCGSGYSGVISASCVHNGTDAIWSTSASCAPIK